MLIPINLSWIVKELHQQLMLDNNSLKRAHESSVECVVAPLGIRFPPGLELLIRQQAITILVQFSDACRHLPLLVGIDICKALGALLRWHGEQEVADFINCNELVIVDVE